MSRECERCFYYGKAQDAPETVEYECMWTPSEDDGWEKPCERTEERDMSQVVYQKTYQEYKTELGNELNKTAEGFVRIGYLLRLAQDTDILKESGYANVNEFAQKEFGLDKSQVSRFIGINERFSEGGYSDRLQDRYQGFGVAKLAIMLQLPDSINEELTPDFSKADITAIREEVKEEEKITDIEVLMEERESEDEEMEPIDWVIRQLGYDRPELYLELYEVSGKPDAGNVEEELHEALAPGGEAIHTVRIPGTGRIMLHVKEEGDAVLTNLREPFMKERVSWSRIAAAVRKIMYLQMEAKESWGKRYGEAYPEAEEPKKAEVAPVQPSSKPKEAPKKQTKVSKAVVIPKETPEPPKAEEEPRQQTLHEVDENIPDVPQVTVEEIIEENKKEETLEVSQENAQIPGQTDIEHDFPEYMPAPVDVEECREELVKLWRRTEQAAAEVSAFFKYHYCDYASTEECTLGRLQEVYKHAIDAAAGLEKMIHVKKHIAG